jgi:hypothetical protein
MKLLTIGLAATALLSQSAVAYGDVASTIRNEITAEGVPNASVSVSAPTPATAADVAAFENDPSADLASLNSANVLSPDPTNPLPIATVRFGPSTVTQLPGTVTPPGEPGLFSQDSQLPLWEATILNATKHAISGGATLAGVALQPTVPGRDSSAPDISEAVPDSSSFNAAKSLVTMSDQAVALQVQLALPDRYSHASVTVRTASGGQQVLSVELDQAPAAFSSDNLSDLVDFAAGEQASLNNTLRANIGEVIVVSRDPGVIDAATGLHSPVFTYAGDPSWGQSFEWATPVAKPFVDRTSASGA